MLFRSFTNDSANWEPVHNIEVNWNGFDIQGSGPNLNFCSGATRSHVIKDFFGPIHAKWENARGKILTKDFILKKSDLPSYKKRHKGNTYVYVTIYFNQEDATLVTSDHPRIKEIESAKAKECIKSSDQRRKRARKAREKRLKELGKWDYNDESVN